jgi:hypothetical protein
MFRLIVLAVLTLSPSISFGGVFSLAENASGVSLASHQIGIGDLLQSDEDCPPVVQTSSDFSSSFYVEEHDASTSHGAVASTLYSVEIVCNRIHAPVSTSPFEGCTTILLRPV